MAMYIVKPWYRKKDDAIYGAEWAGTSDPSWVRTDAAVGFANPNPYYSGMSTTPSSPFDNIMPWAGIRRVTDASAGKLVEIPKFYYKWTRDGVKMKLQISMSQFDGSHVSPAHADRGDGVGERDYVYVGRYHCASDYKSKTGVSPVTRSTRNTYRSGIHNLGSNIWQYDYAMLWTISMLYLVEYASWDCQAKIGFGCGSPGTVGDTDNMPYHTGTMQSNKSTYAKGVQYRYIEGLWDNKLDWVDGINFSGTDVYCQKNPSLFSDGNNNYVKVGTRPSTSGYSIKSWTEPQVAGYEWALHPKTIEGNSGQYITDGYDYNSNGTLMCVGGYVGNHPCYGMFYMYEAYTYNSYGDTVVSCRLMVLPPSRLSA